jgi:cellulose synthase/poly-beta-1,6-N-acetylglucosamine synthase-like glycosyltransferase
MPQPPERSIKISVVVICFNQEHTIGAALGSVLAQSAWSRIGEVIVVDDCSTDGSVAVIRQIAARHPRIHVIARTTNSGGCAVPRNDGIRQTTGTHVALLDGTTSGTLTRLQPRSRLWRHFHTWDCCFPTISGLTMRQAGNSAVW